MKSSVETWRKEGLSDQQIWERLQNKLARSLNITFAYLKKTGKIGETLELLFKLGVFLLRNKVEFNRMIYKKGRSLTLYFKWQQYAKGFSIRNLDAKKPLSSLDVVCGIVGFFPSTVGFMRSEDFSLELNISREYSTKHGKKEHLVKDLISACKGKGIQLIS